MNFPWKPPFIRDFPAHHAWCRAAVSLPPIFGPGICGRLGASGCQPAGRQHGADGAQPCRRDTWGNRGDWEHLGETSQWINRGFLHENQPMVDDNEIENQTVELAPLFRSNGLFIWPTKRGYETGIRFVFFYIIRWYDGRIGIHWDFSWKSGIWPTKRHVGGFKYVPS